MYYCAANSQQHRQGACGSSLLCHNYIMVYASYACLLLLHYTRVLLFHSLQSRDARILRCFREIVLHLMFTAIDAATVAVAFAVIQ